MPANKNALIRYKTIDNCLRNRYRRWTLDDLVLFPAVASDGALPRKTFSMGEAVEKRYYIEARRLV